MLEYILEMVENILAEAKTLSEKEKGLIRDQVSYAIRQTRFHITRTRADNKDEASALLSNIWQRTGSKIKSIKNVEIKHLAETIQEKSKYWSDPSQYSKELLDRRRMRLTQIEEIIDAL